MVVNLKHKKYTVAMVILILSGFLNTRVSANELEEKASELVFTMEKTEYYYEGISSITGLIRSDYVWVFKIGGKPVFCIESGVPVSEGSIYSSEPYTAIEEELLSKITYYSYILTDKTHYDYALTQVLIWEVLGNTNSNTDIPNYQKRKEEIMQLVNNHNETTSWNNESYDIVVGDTLTLTDENGVFKNLELESNQTNTTFEKEGNQLIITPTSEFESGSIIYLKDCNILLTLEYAIMLLLFKGGIYEQL